MGVTIGPFPLSAAPRVWIWLNEFRARVCDDYAAATLAEFVEKLQGRAYSGEQQWAVYRDGEICGFITFQPDNPVCGWAHCLFRRDFWGRATTETALRMVAREIFAAGYRKISMVVFSDNNAVKALLRQLGTRQEGLLRHQTMRGGRPVDMAILGLLAHEFEREETAECPGTQQSKASLQSEAESQEP